MFRAVHRSSSGALTVFAASGLHTHVVTGHSQVGVGTDTIFIPGGCVRFVQFSFGNWLSANNLLLI
jgi:hypothetical protein